MIKEVLSEAESRMRKTVEVMEADLRAIRTGRASPALLDRVMVEYYGAMTPLNQLAVISAPEPQLITVRPYDPGSLGDIQKGILKSELGLTPASDGRIIRLPIPRLTEERRRDLAKLVRQRVEEGKVALRNIRRETLDDLRDFEKEKMISEDDFYDARDKTQDLINDYSKRMDEIGERKQQDILEG
ncbi:MAG: ribosome recycling factor [Anaerolineae bacterium]|nr:ribosome recycling factor [Anaerolineae bacterium]